MTAGTRFRRRSALAGALLALGGCAGIDGPGSVIIPNERINVSSSLHVPLEALPLLVAAYYVIDPLAPNWQVQESPLAPDRFRIVLRKKRFTTGGDGESGQVFRRRAEALVRERGYTSYEVLELVEGIESNVPIAQRVTTGVVRLHRPSD